jgi:hypothetical protein
MQTQATIGDNMSDTVKLAPVALDEESVAAETRAKTLPFVFHPSQSCEDEDGGIAAVGRRVDRKTGEPAGAPLAIAQDGETQRAVPLKRVYALIRGGVIPAETVLSLLSHSESGRDAIIDACAAIEDAEQETPDA